MMEPLLWGWIVATVKFYLRVRTGVRFLPFQVVKDRDLLEKIRMRQKEKHVATKPK